VSPFPGALAPPEGVAVEETRAARIWVARDGILHLVLRQGAVVKLPEAIEFLEAGRRLFGHAVFPCLADIRGVNSTDHAVRAFFHENEDLPVNRVAFFVGSTLSRTIGNFFLGLGRFMVPARLFTDYDEAIAWLKLEGRGGAG
jgi:hypothetical protein